MSNDDTIKVPGTKAVAIMNGPNDAAPTIAAKGHGFLAEKILDIAFAEGVKVRQDKDLVELLDAFDIDCPVPLEALHAVSLILERVYAENNKLETRQSPQSSDTVDIPVAQPMSSASGGSQAPDAKGIIVDNQE